MSKYNRQASPERANIRRERCTKYVQNRRVPVIYYLCQNRQLEHPHFMEVPLSSPEGLYLRDVIERLNALRGKGMASMYSWSCKRSYKNGFVWHDLCEDDLIIPARGANEYVLKGSEVVEDSNSGRTSTSKVQNVKQLTEAKAPLFRSQEGTSSSSTSMSGNDSKLHHKVKEDEFSPPSRSSGSSGASLESRIDNGSSTCPTNSLTLNQYKTCRRQEAANASTQTEDKFETELPDELTRETKTLTDGDSAEGGQVRSHAQQMKLDSCTYLPSSSKGEQDARTLEALIKFDVQKRNNIGEGSTSTSTNVASFDVKTKASNVLMHLISCGSITVKDNSYGLVPAYRPQFSQLKFPSPLYSTSMMLGELDCLWENQRPTTGMRSEDKEYFSGSLLQTKMHKEESQPAPLKRSSQESNTTTIIKEEAEERTQSPSLSPKCLPCSIKSSLCKHQQQPILEKPRKSSARPSDSSVIISRDASNASSKRTTEPSPINNQSHRLDYFHAADDKVIQIKERLSSGARVIFQSHET